MAQMMDGMTSDLAEGEKTLDCLLHSTTGKRREVSLAHLEEKAVVFSGGEASGFSPSAVEMQGIDKRQGDTNATGFFSFAEADAEN